MDISQYFYFVGTTTIVPIWIYLFKRRDKRKDMLFIGISLGFAGIVYDKLSGLLDYWNPVFMIPGIPLESFYYGFIFGGISAELYEVILGKRNSKRKLLNTHKYLVLLIAIITSFSFWLVVETFHINSILACIIPPISVAIISVSINKEIVKASTLNGLFMVLITIYFFQILLLINPNLFEEYWNLEKLSGILVFSIPVEELLFAFTFGFSAAHLYEIIFGFRVVKK